MDGVDISKLPELSKPQDFMKLENLEIVYEGYLQNYLCDKQKNEIEILKYG